MQLFRTIILALIALCCSLAYHPVFFTQGEAANNTPVVMILLGLLVILSIFTIRQTGIKNPLILSMYFFTFVITIVSFILLIAGLYIEPTEALPYIQVLLGFTLGYNLTLSEDQWHVVLRTYMLTSMVMGVLLILSMVGSFHIEEQYLVHGKNASGVMIALSGGIAFYLARVDKYRLIRLLDYLFFVLLVVELLVFRARLATLSLLIFTFLFLLKDRNFKFLIGVGLVVLALAVIFPSAQSFITDSFLMNKDADITSGREELNEEALTIINQSPLMGNLKHDFSFLDETNVHNYILKRLSDFGVYISLPWIIIYLIIGLTLVVRLFGVNHKNHLQILSYLLMIILFIESMGEYSYPFYPGTVTFLPFILFGFSERERVLSGNNQDARSVTTLE